MALKIGEPAPQFSLYDSDRNKVNLKDQLGSNVVLLFFPAAFTSVCTAELCTTRDNISLYNNANAKVFGISVDSVFALSKFKEEQHLNFPLLSDFNKETSRAYDALYETFGFDMLGVSKRAAFVIDEKGIITYAEVLENAGEQPDFTKIKAALHPIPDEALS